MATSADVHWQSTLTLWNRRGRGGHNNQKQSLGATMASSGDTVWTIGGWIDAATVVPKEIDHATNARNIYLHLKEDIQRQWRIQGPPPTKDLSLGDLNAYKYDDLKTDNTYIGFYFLRMRFSDDSYLYARVGLTRTKHCSPDLRKVSNNEADVYKT